MHFNFPSVILEPPLVDISKFWLMDTPVFSSRRVSYQFRQNFSGGLGILWSDFCLNGVYQITLLQQLKSLKYQHSIDKMRKFWFNEPPWYAKKDNLWHIKSLFVDHISCVRKRCRECCEFVFSDGCLTKMSAGSKFSPHCGENLHVPCSELHPTLPVCT